MPRLGDHERRPRADDAGALAQDHLDVARVTVAGELARTLGRLDSSEPTTRPSAFETAFWATTTTSRVLEPAGPLGGVGEQRREIVAGLDLRDALERE